MGYLPFEVARTFVHKLGLKGEKEWRVYYKSGKKPSNIPTNPSGVYKDKGWKGWGDWLGTGTIASNKIQFKSFEEAKEFAHSLKLKGQVEWTTYCKSPNKVPGIPYHPERTYKKYWKDWGDWLGTGTIASFNKQFKSFEEARKFTHSLNLKSKDEWAAYCKSEKKPNDIPADPPGTYANSWKGWGDWLGTGTIASFNKQFKSFEEARKFTHSLNLKSKDEWAAYCKSEKKPNDIPADPPGTYANSWKGWGDWLGTGTIASFNKQFKSFEEARAFVHRLGLKGKEEWIIYSQSEKKPNDIPADPSRTYKKKWIDWWDWLGNENTDWSVRNVKTLLRALIESKVIFNWDEAVQYSLLHRNGLHNLHGNRHEQFFKNVIQASHTDRGRKLIEAYAYSNSEIPPNLSILHRESTDDSEEIQTSSATELPNSEYDDPLDYGNVETAQQILKHTNIFDSINVDEEAMKFYVNYSISKLWKSAFQNEKNTVQTIKEEGHNGNKYHDAIIDSFLRDYDGSLFVKSKIPHSYSLQYLPKLMQFYVAHKIRTLSFFANFSGTGAGKTLSAIIASRVIYSKMTVIVCPNDVVDQWKISILQTFPDSEILTGRDAFYTKYSENKYQYIVLNYDKFNQEDSPNLILKLAMQKIDFIILDEIHFTKIRDEEIISQRRKNLDGLMTAIRKKNPDLKILGLSATPVVNNLREGKSLLELITGKIYDDVATKPTVPNAVTLYEKLSTISIRELPKYNVKTDTHFVNVEAQRPANLSIKMLKSNPLAIEKFLTDARIPEIVKNVEGQTIIYTEYVEDIIKKLSEAISQEGYSFALYTGDDKSGLSRFLDKKVQVLIASRPISVGVDRLQYICNRLIINTLPWTNAQYQQLLGRLVRMGQIKDVVHIYIIKASIAGYEYDELKWKRIQFKRTLADCAVDGILPEKNLITPQQAAMEAVKWLERLERGEISTVVRRDLNVELSPIEIKKRVIKYGDFTKLNSKINTENSDTTHHRMLKEPKEWEEYHRQYREARKSWSIIPYEEIIKRIKQLSPRLLIGDFGCGEAKILEAFGEKRVESFDHVAINNKVTACDMKSVPLPEEAIDIAVFSLSLMGRNWQDYIAEAKRCLATGGYLLIVETTKSVKGRLSGIRDSIKKQGFEIYVDEERGDFTLIEAREI